MRYFCWLIILIFSSVASAQDLPKLKISAIDRNECNAIAEKIRSTSKGSIGARVSIKDVSDFYLGQHVGDDYQDYSADGQVCHIETYDTEIPLKTKGLSLEYSVLQPLGFDVENPLMLADGCGLTGGLSAVSNGKTICLEHHWGECLDGDDGCGATDEECKKVLMHQEIDCLKTPEVFKKNN